ncbi:MAG TPA: hypothetical protein VJJ52_04190 [Candidatus Nanoarchaeia archaeon]|nr:hypothetical protein [Candidatus Nanoarchaeia archaeon]
MSNIGHIKHGQTLSEERLVIDKRVPFKAGTIVVSEEARKRDYYFMGKGYSEFEVLPVNGTSVSDYPGDRYGSNERMFQATVLGTIMDENTLKLLYASSVEPNQVTMNSRGIPIVHKVSVVSLDDVVDFHGLIPKK